MSELYRFKAHDRAGQLKYRWESKLIANEETLYVFYGDWDRDLEQADGTKVPVTNQSLEFYWTDRDYMISTIYNEVGTLQEYYGRAISDVKLNETDRSVSYVLLGSDLQIAPNYKYDIVSPDEVDQPDAAESANDGWLDLFMLFERREGPFDPEFLSRFESLVKLSK